MQPSEKQRTGWAIGVFWILLLYIITALVWWFVSLQKQNLEMIELKKNTIIDRYGTGQNLQQKELEFALLAEEERKNLHKYLGEGITFLALILVGAGFVYRSFKRQLKTQQQQQHFLMAVTHELKTPIAVTKLNLETLQRHQLEAAKKDKLIQMTIEEINRLNTLTSNILYSSQLEGGSHTISREELNFSDLVNGTLREFRARYPNRQWENEVEDDIELKGDPLLLKILVSNLLENAHKYAPPETVITIRLKSSGPAAELQVSDLGKGIPDAEKTRIFRKFYRIGDESTRTTKGTGLGLYLCKKIVNDLRGKIMVRDNRPSGSTFVVRLMRHQPHE